jgi:hypothetical protein
MSEDIFDCQNWRNAGISAQDSLPQQRTVLLKMLGELRVRSLAFKRGL